MHPHRSLTILAVILFTFTSFAGTRQMSFEEVVSGSTTILIGVIESKDDRGIEDPSTRAITRETVVRVSRCLYGTCADSISLRTPGGIITQMVNGVPTDVEIRDTATPVLPATGTTVLLFLKSDGSSYRIFSASHGLRIVEGDDNNGSVILSLRSHELASKDARLDRNGLFTEAVPVDRLADLIGRARRAPPSRPSRGDH